ncbi:hypothetical protein EVB81_087 [Rhizobium phage RHph_I46]|uniref:Uncharacterized protein n=1 Tax=Rhizobium phage RHph_I1_9 TaxID=2509729 RepID=A0A7S5UZL4_9CAUD|nr:hypothetical protein PP936_gp086 [Rhizobium phage RHph_I1_9]QIG69656.1 hypothetical protein EVB81_087 [Rhizobium phage RHph_I46]QIG70937.1 hypothetical protein EVB92_087 [Rhizobium phage RHph_I9]QIG73523.1 hypothetical protein EVC04_086 [Rhizobium phage RHph_I1_9]QIG76276.1 hypothetical protein EVC25_087 [Rhizobium phage RHph_I34]
MRLSTLNFTSLPTEIVDILHRDSGYEGNTIIDSKFTSRVQKLDGQTAFEYLVTLTWDDTKETEKDLIFVVIYDDGSIKARYGL